MASKNQKWVLRKALAVCRVRAVPQAASPEDLVGALDKNSCTAPMILPDEQAGGQQHLPASASNPVIMSYGNFWQFYCQQMHYAHEHSTTNAACILDCHILSAWQLHMFTNGKLLQHSRSLPCAWTGIAVSCLSLVKQKQILGPSVDKVSFIRLNTQLLTF